MHIQRNPIYYTGGDCIMNIHACSREEQDYIIDRLVEYNLSQVEAKQKEKFIDLSKKIVKDDKIFYHL